MEKDQVSITKTIEMFLENIGLSRSQNTEKTYRNAMNAFVDFLTEKGIEPDNTIDALNEKIFGDYAKYLKAYSPSTESLYINVAKNYFEFLAAEEIKTFNLLEMRRSLE